ncbi:TIR domain-containing protein [Sorangium sp. So ce321]|uniref:TIR domain-containing protein n=1 Tax=Sorangium sp. So ce321 TaxID=3133300 RepID=UPI003F63A858
MGDRRPAGLIPEPPHVPDAVRTASEGSYRWRLLQLRTLKTRRGSCETQVGLVPCNAARWPGCWNPAELRRWLRHLRLDRAHDIHVLMSPTPAPTDVFISYVAADEAHRNELITHLAVLRRQEKLRIWDSPHTDVSNGQDTDVVSKIETANTIILLVSAKYLADDKRWHEMERAVARHSAREAHVLPVILSACDWTNTPLSCLGTLPKERTILASSNQFEEWASVVSHIRNLLRGSSPTSRVE